MRVRGALLSLINCGICFRVRLLMLLALLGCVVCPQATAQIFGLSVTTPTNSVTVNSSVTFTINLTNFSGQTLLNVFATNTFSGPAAVQFVAADTSQGTITTNANSEAFSLGQMSIGGVAQMIVTLKPTVVGPFTNSVVIASTLGTNIASTNLILQATPATSDLAVSLTPPSVPLLSGDLTSYSVTVTNLGTNAAAGVTLTNTGYNVLKLLSLSPTNQTYTLTNGLLLFNLGTMNGHTGKSFQFFVQPTNSGTLNLSATITATNIIESNTNNNTVATNITVGALVTGDLIATNASTMVLNKQTGLMQQTVRLVNISTNPVASARVIVSGLTNRLYNAVGTNSGNPYVVYSAPLAAGTGVDLLMEYFNPSRVAFNVPDSAYTAVGTEAVIVSVTSVPGANITLFTNLGPAGMLIEFTSVTNRAYTIYYSSDASFTNPRMAQPSIIAVAPTTQWIDNGPPKTSSHPSTDSSRFYRVIPNP